MTDPSMELLTIIARKIGETAGIPNHIQRAKIVWSAIEEFRSRSSVVELAVHNSPSAHNSPAAHNSGVGGSIPPGTTTKMFKEISDVVVNLPVVD